MTRWTDAEREVVAESWDPCDAWENYRVAFGMNHRTYEGIKREFYRQHPQVTA